MDPDFISAYYELHAEHTERLSFWYDMCMESPGVQYFDDIHGLLRYVFEKRVGNDGP